MRTDDLIDLLARGPLDVRRGQFTRRLGFAAVTGLVLASVASVVWQGLRPDFAAAWAEPAMWAKTGFLAAMLAAGLWASARLARPGLSLGAAGWAIAAPVVLVWLWAAIELAGAAAGEGAGLVLGHTWMYCPVRVATLSIPAFALAVWALRGLAPTRLRRAGAAAGLFSGGVGALAYSLHCPEMAGAFIGTWYVLGMLAPTLLGALLGPRLLRW